MSKTKESSSISRRNFVKTLSGGVMATAVNPLANVVQAKDNSVSDIFHVDNIPDDPFVNKQHKNYHSGIEMLLPIMGDQGLKFYRSNNETLRGGSQGLIAADDVVLIKVNAQWKHRGCTNSDLIRGLVQRILDHPDDFTGEVVIFENGQGRGSLDCDTSSSYDNRNIYANANNEKHSFTYLVDHIFQDSRVSYYLLDPIRSTIIGGDDHHADGYRVYESVSYPCFTTSGGNRVELREGLWNGSKYNKNKLKLINVPVLKHHDLGGSEITGAIKHVYGILSMSDGQAQGRHYNTLGDTCGKMFVSVHTPVLNIMDAIWVSHGALAGYPERTTFRANQIAASQDPVALDYWTAKHILYPIDSDNRHHPDFLGIKKWLKESSDIINKRGGLQDLNKGILVDKVTQNENKMRIFKSFLYSRHSQKSSVRY